MTPLPRIAQPDTVYLRNMRALWEVDPQLAQQIDAVADEQLPELMQTRSGDFTVQLSAPDGRSITLHSKYDPVAEARRFADAVQLADSMCVIVYGFGLGYHVREICRRLGGDQFVVAAEANVPLLRSAMEKIDFSDIIAAKQLLVLTEADQQHVFTRLQPRNAMLLLGVTVTSHQPSEQLAPAFYSRMRELVAAYIGFCRTAMITLLANSTITCRNIANNLPAYVSTPPIDCLRGRFEGYPAIIVSAGPSLAKNVHLLKQAKGRAVIIAVQTTLKVLLQHGIVPDFVTSLDYNEVSRRFFEGVEPRVMSQIHLVAEPKATWKVIDAYTGPVSLLANDFANACIKPLQLAKDGLRAGSTVAHLAFYLAEYIGADPIVFVGQDLGFPDGHYYTPGVAVHAMWSTELNRFSTLETKEWERIARHRRSLRKVADVHGQMIYTDEQMFTYIQQFQRDFAASSAQIIDATEGGAKLEHTEIAPLAEVLQRSCNRPIPAGKFDYLRQQNWWDDSMLEQARENVRRRREQARQFLQICEQTLAVLKELRGLVDQPREFAKKMARIDELRTKVDAMGEIYAMISEVSQLAELRRFTADLRLEMDKLEGPDRQKRQITRDVEYVSSLADGCRRLCDILDGAVERFEQASNKRLAEQTV